MALKWAPRRDRPVALRRCRVGLIRALPADVVEKIAAGEVVERPASVVKELVENAIDAGAAAISVDIEGGGLRRIRVSDDGCGMDAEDLVNSLRRHATSKITSADDLWRISTMGFRGEAIASIGAVSRLSIESRVNDPRVIEGARVEMSAGVIGGPVPAGCAPGTSVIVGDLFYNVPARRKFIRSERVEAGHAVDAVFAAALAFPRVRFDVKADGRRETLAAAVGDADEEAGRERVAAVLGSASSEGLAYICESAPGLSIAGFVSERGRASGRDVHFFVNRRPVKDRVLMHALSQAFEGRLDRGASPSAVLWIEIDPARVDVNVHPAKREVKFAAPSEVHSFLMSAVKKRISSKAPAVSLPAASTDAGAPGPSTEARALAAVMRFERDRLVRAPRFTETSQTSFPAQEPRMRPLGQFGRAYIACEGEAGELVIIDQHAAHERLGFDALVAQYASGRVAQQRLLVPEHVELARADAAAISERAQLLAEAGFEIEPFGGGTIVVKAVPEILGGSSVSLLMQRLASEFAEMDSAISLDDARKRVFALAACHMQVRAGDALAPQEIASLVRDVEREAVTSCPHGRPALVRIERDQIEKWFKRK